jgi:hypothetical protein
MLFRNRFRNGLFEAGFGVTFKILVCAGVKSVDGRHKTYIALLDQL